MSGALLCLTPDAQNRSVDEHHTHSELHIRLYSHDPCNHRDPFAFKPERFMSVDDFEPEMDPGSTVFGFGRRYAD